MIRGARRILLSSVAVALVSSGSSAEHRRVVVLGVDGMDYALTRRLMDEGALPHIKELAERGTFGPLQTVAPPQSPVAWATVITGAGAGVHGIGDFIHRDPKTMTPMFSMARAVPAGRQLALGDYVIPLGSGGVELMRRGEAFWNRFCDEGIPARVVRMPANFPPDARCGCVQCLSGMGTPDLAGSYGTFTYYSSAEVVEERRSAAGIFRRAPRDGPRVELSVPGPPNDYRAGRPPVSAPFVVHLDREHGAARIDLGEQQVVLKPGEWSEWLRVEFPLLGAVASVGGIVRFHLESVDPEFRLYVSPVNVDPLDPALPISSPARLSNAMAREAGRFYTQGMPEDTKALAAGALSDEAYLAQAQIVWSESMRLLRLEMDRSEEGMLFFYFSTIDQVSHGMWRQFDPASPTHSAAFAARFGNPVETFYRQLDGVVGYVGRKLDMPDDVLIVMSDHGFCAFTREVELNRWLQRERLLAVRPEAMLTTATLADIDWSGTRAYNLGLNAVYLNIKGRERDGIVDPADAPRLCDELTTRLKSLRDPETGESVVSEVWRTSELYPGPEQKMLPDLIVGFRPPYRISWASALGASPPGGVVKVNRDKWSGDHCVDPKFVPGVIISSVGLDAEGAGLADMAPTLLGLYGVAPGESVEGRSLLRGAGQ